ncbi:MAG: hypothetical protein ACYCQK_06175 [Acidiferrobacteraceae bacterium]
MFQQRGLQDTFHSFTKGLDEPEDVDVRIVRLQNLTSYRHDSLKGRAALHEISGPLAAVVAVDFVGKTHRKVVVKRARFEQVPQVACVWIQRELVISQSSLQRLHQL